MHLCSWSESVRRAIHGVTYSLLESVMAYVNCNASVLMVGERLSAIHGKLRFA